jgi:hypothetical protein
MSYVALSTTSGVFDSGKLGLSLARHEQLFHIKDAQPFAQLVDPVALSGFQLFRHYLLLRAIAEFLESPHEYTDVVVLPPILVSDSICHPHPVVKISIVKGPVYLLRHEKLFVFERQTGYRFLVVYESQTSKVLSICKRTKQPHQDRVVIFVDVTPPDYIAEGHVPPD